LTGDRRFLVVREIHLITSDGGFISREFGEQICGWA
jgi:hypothetical protein